MSELKVIVGVCRQDNPADVDEAYGAGTYERLFPSCDGCGERDRKLVEVDDNDPSSGYVGKVLLCPQCLEQNHP